MMFRVIFHVRCMVWCLAALFAAGGAFAQNLIYNGDFELGSTSQWNLWNPDSQTVSWGWTNNSPYVHSGTYSAYIGAFGGTTSDMGIYNESASLASLSGGTMLRARVYIKTVNVAFQDTTKAGLTYSIRAFDSLGTLLTYSHGTCNIKGDNDWLELTTYYQIPPTGANYMDFMIHLDSGLSSGYIFWDDVSIEAISVGAPHTDAILAQVASDAGGTPRLKINGSAVTPAFFFGNTGCPVMYDQIAKAGVAGVNLVEIPVDLPWKSFSMGSIEQALRANPNALVMLRFFVSPPQWWRDTHPNDVMRDENGTAIPVSLCENNISLASDDWFNAIKAQITQAVGLIHNSSYKNKVIGYHFDSSEWFVTGFNDHYLDYAPINVAKFQTWAATKYSNSISALNAKWQTSYTSFAQVALPGVTQWTTGADGLFRNPAVNTWAADYCEFHNNQEADRLIELAQQCKQDTSSRSLSAFFYGYQNELINNGYRRGIGHSGHLALRRTLASSAVDIICAPFSYFDRGVGDPMNMMSAVDAITRAGKLALQENDARTYLWNPPDLTDWHYSTYNDTLSCLRRDFGNILAHNQAVWWMDLIANGSFNDTGIWNTNAKCVQSYADSIAYAQALAPQIALIYDEDSNFWLRADNYNLTASNSYTMRSVFQSCGAQVGYYHLEDIPYIPSSAKLIVFVNTWRVTSADATLINQLKSGGRTLLWLYAPGYVGDSSLSVSAMSTLTGLPLTRRTTWTQAKVTVASSGYHITDGLSGHQFGQLPDGTISPTFYGTTGGSFVTLGTYTGTSYPALIMKDNSTWRSIFCGTPLLDVPTLRAIARYAGVNLLVDGDLLDRADAVNMNSRYFYVYGRGSSGTRVFNVPCEEIPNGSFERQTGALATSGFNTWVSPYYGSMTCDVAAGSYVGNNGCHTWGFSNGAGVYNVPLGMDVALEDGKTYEVSCWVWVRDLVTANAGANDYIYITMSPYAWNANSRAFMIAQGTANYMSPTTWTQFTTTYTHNKYSNQQPQMLLLLKVYGRYSASDIIIDHVSVREQGTSTVGTVQNYMTSTNYLHGVTTWNDYLDLSTSTDTRQKIFGLYP